ncbi:formyl peptide receptor 2-like [Hoplias malabaricus]|uniref:formyl peptide receptor 2-like n=1 Tax=Hoplias malabaricus TaxID=27720 RepID=UPI003461E48A
MTSTPVTETYIPEYDLGNNDTGMDPLKMFYLVSSMIIIVLGLTGNGLVIWIAGFKVQKSVISIWYLSLAVSDFLFCSTLPFLFYYMIKNTWIFGQFMCYFIYLNISLNLYCSIFLLTIISVDRCVIVMFPVLAQNQRTVKKASMVVVLVWFTSAILYVPALVIPHSENIMVITDQCQIYIDSAAIPICEFIFAFLIPFLIFITCCFIIIRKLKTMQMVSSKKPFRIMTVLSATFLICWLPYHIVKLMYISIGQNEFLNIMEVIAFILISTNSCLNPFLYAFMGKDFKKQFYAILSNIENAMEEEDNQSTDRGTNLTRGGSQHTTTISSVL